MQSTLFFNRREHICSNLSRQTLLMAKLTSFFLLVFCFHVAARTDAQTVTFSAKNARVIEILKHIQTQTGYNIISEQALLSHTDRISVSFNNTPLAEALTSSLQGLSIDFKLDGKTIVLKRADKKVNAASLPARNTDSPADVAAVLLRLKGKVATTDGVPLAKVSVHNLTSRKGTLSAEDGSFEIEANIGDNLSFTYVGYGSKLVKVSSANNLYIELPATETNLDEFVVTGYETIRKKRMTGSISSVKAEDLLINGATTIEQTLQGKMPGVEIVNNSGMVGTRQTVRVRGTSTLLGNQEPVWVVDGIIQEDPLPFKASELNAYNAQQSNSEALKNFIGSTIAWLNPYDIEEITVLKDAASTAIYGVKAANGVILINTKRGKNGRAPVVSYNTSISTQDRLTYDKMNLMNSKERVDVSREIWENGVAMRSSLDNIGYTGLLRQYLEDKMSYDEFNKGVKQLELNNTDWFALLYQKPLNQSHNLSVSGGGANSSYYASFGANSQKGQAKGNGQIGYQGSVNITSNITSRLTATVKIAGSYTKTGGFFKIDPYTYATRTNRVIRAYDEDGALHYYYKNSGGQGITAATSGEYLYNILNEMDGSGNVNYSTSLNSNITARYRFNGGFSVESVFGINYANVNSTGYQTERTFAITAIRGYEYGAYGPQDALYQQSKLPNGGLLSTMYNSNYNYTWRNGLNYGRTFNKVHAVSGLAGTELRSNIYKSTNATVYGYMPDRGLAVVAPPPIILNVSGTTIANTLYQNNTTSTSVTDRVSNYVSYYATGGYTYDNRYTASLSVRGDASNRFGQDVRTKFKPIWAAGARWNIANEKFFNRTEWLNDLSFRASYGYQGNVAENFGPELILTIPTASSTLINNLTGEYTYRIGSLPYANLRWEKTQTVNLGLDFSFFKNRVGASFEYYEKRSKDLIVMKEVPFENGVKMMPVNGGSLYNRGIELSLNFIPVRTKDVTWNLGVTPSRNINKVISKQVQNPTWQRARSGTYYVEGYAASSFWVFDFIGLDPQNGQPLFNIPTSSDDPNAAFDAVAFMKYAGKLNADFTSGFNTSLRYKTLTLSTSLYLSVGNQKLLSPLFNNGVAYGPNEFDNLPKDLIYRWRKPGDELITNIPSIPSADQVLITIPSGSGTFDGVSQQAQERVYTLYNFSSARVVNASYLRVGNIVLNYTLPAHIAKLIYSKTASIGYSVNNLHTFVSKDYKGVDPEVASGSQPLARVHSINLAISF